MKLLLEHFLLPPFSLLVLLLAAVLLLAWTSPRRGARAIAVACLGLSVLASTAAVSELALSMLHVGAGWPDGGGQAPKAVVVPTAGAYRDATGIYRPDPGSVDRLAAGLAAARAFDLPLVLTGGAPDGGPPEATVVLYQFDTSPVRLLTDTEATNTRENAAAARRLLEPLGIDTVLLATDRWHAPRMAACLRAEGFRVWHVASDLRAEAVAESWLNWVPSNAGLRASRALLRMVAGLALYIARDWIDLADLTG